VKGSRPIQFVRLLIASTTAIALVAIPATVSADFSDTAPMRCRVIPAPVAPNTAKANLWYCDDSGLSTYEEDFVGDQSQGSITDAAALRDPGQPAGTVFEPIARTEHLSDGSIIWSDYADNLMWLWTVVAPQTYESHRLNPCTPGAPPSACPDGQARG
jgi:hypothetical protein